MDTFSACVAFGPLAIYLLLLGAINLSRRPLVVTGVRETLSLGLALMGLAVVGPMQLFMPQEAAGHFGPLVWLLLASFYLLCLTLVLLLSRPRLVVYNISLESLHAALNDVARRIDSEAVWAGNALSLPAARVHLQVENFAPLSNVSLVATGDDQSAPGWRRLEYALRTTLKATAAPGPSHGFWLVVWSLVILVALGFWIVDDPQTIARGIQRMLQP